MAVAATFSCACSGEPVPGIGKMAGELFSSQASTTWRSVARRFCAATASAARLSVCWIGAHGRKTMSSCSHRSISGSESRSVTLNRFWMDTIGTIRFAWRYCSSVTLERPTWRILPSFFSSAIAPTDSASGTFGSGR